MTPAAHYAALRPPERSRLGEGDFFSSRKWTEIELQASWFAGEFGTRFQATGGEEVRIVQFGVWNREAGPDFAEAAVSINGAAPIRGSVELDPDARDWERHGHAVNPDYESVILHIFLQKGSAAFFTRTARNRNVLQVLLDPSKLGEEPPRSAPLAKPGRCLAPLRDLPGGKAADILDAAAQFRLQNKAARIARAADAHGADEALYQALAATLGYKGNTFAFTLLTQRLPLRLLLREKERVDSLLFGVSGFLPHTGMGRFPQETRSYLRAIWEGWWPERDKWERLALKPERWRTGGVRPANHPQRRVAALAQIVRHWGKVRRLKESLDPKRIHAFFAGLHDEYWDLHYTLTAEGMTAPMALVGESRVTEMLANVFYPLAILAEPAAWSGYANLAAASVNRRVETAAIRLFGGMPQAKEMLKTAARQQGLMQIYEDFCMKDNSDCAECLFPQQIGQWR